MKTDYNLSKIEQTLVDLGVLEEFNEELQKAWKEEGFKNIQDIARSLRLDPDDVNIFGCFVFASTAKGWDYWLTIYKKIKEY